MQKKILYIWKTIQNINIFKSFTQEVYPVENLGESEIRTSDYNENIMNT